MVDRGRMKILEFDGDDGETKERRRDSTTFNRSMKILEFGNDPSVRERPAAPPRTIGPMKIIEFDNEPLRDDPRALRRAAPGSLPTEKLGRMKIVDVEEERTRPAEPPRRKGIKIIEFD